MNKVGENTKINVVKKILRTTAKVVGPTPPNSKKKGRWRGELARRI
jgi:hypothetical protein